MISFFFFAVGVYFGFKAGGKFQTFQKLYDETRTKIVNFLQRN